MSVPPRVALVTGSSSGIGAAIARALHADGWRVALNGHRDADAGAALAAALPGATYVDADVSAPDDARRLVRETVDAHGRLDAVVNNAGIARRIPHDDLDAVDDAFWDLVMAVNLKGPWNVARAARPHLAAARGQIVMTGSIAGFTAAGSSIPYSVSKAGVLHLTRLLARALGPEIRVNAIAPGYIETPLTREWQPLREHVVAHAPARRLGVPEDVAGAVVGLMGMEYVTGAVLPVDGGLSLL
ncbi:SDR family oxidoreductase [Roseisolibacter sp. H3M3-2]|uniref:SDR family NAD(P)-dependent oxidoreductase n=1 Tax=Roseisolibacter sp. H3M3-2 TaxID=3031323 RepID=UPI0023DB4FFB|nr:SDR family oxidoreductase [Roseisolibacter sp. H3M3-2]MDF1506113.1 SDR family oxidoreductase [Roseisolibacter sp. H3M3-2]